MALAALRASMVPNTKFAIFQISGLNLSAPHSSPVGRNLRTMEPLRKPSDCDDWIRELEGPLARYAASLGLNPHDAQDAVQDGLIALVRTVSKNPETVKNPKAYAFTIVRNNANKLFRERSKRKEVELPEEILALEANDSLHDEIPLMESFRAAYSRLSQEDAALLHKYYVEHQTYQDIANEMGCTAQNVWKTIKKIVSQILATEVRKELERTDPDFAKELFTH
jgi:RNA polymerase sigma factor (sigma-70 family)